MPTQSISEIFNNKLFRIPDYQRGYSWGNKQLEEFWADLDNLSGTRNHYAGVLTLQKADITNLSANWDKDDFLIQKRYSPCYVVDGQQRLTTIIILLQQIINKIDDKQTISGDTKEQVVYKYIKRQYTYNNIQQTSYIFGYESDVSSDKYLKEKILGNPRNPFPDNEMTIYTRNLEEATKFFQKKLAGVNIASLEKLFEKLTSCLQFNIYEISTELDAYMIFETTNNRGKSLSKLELLKNRLLYLNEIAPIPISNQSRFQQIQDTLKQKINSAWKVIYEYLGKNKEMQLVDDEFLRHHYFMYFEYNTKTAHECLDLLLNEEFNITGGISLTKIEDYVTSISDSVVVWFKIKNPELWFKIKYPRYKYPDANLDLEAKISIWLAKLNRLSFPPFNTCLMALMLKRIDDTDLQEVIELMERYTFLVFRISQRNTGTGKNLFYKMANTICDNNITLKDFKKDFKKDLFDITKKYFKPALTPWTIKIRRLFTDKKGGFSSWNGLRYFLFEYELSLQKNLPEEITWKKFDKLEHIFPAPAMQSWKGTFGKFSANDQIKLCHSLGNLLYRESNPLTNSDFVNKKATYTTSYSEIDVASNTNWTEVEILARGIKMLEFMEERWGISIGDDARKKQVLFLDFL